MIINKTDSNLLKQITDYKVNNSNEHSSNLFDTHLMSWPGLRLLASQISRFLEQWRGAGEDKLNNWPDLRTQLSQIKPHELVFLFMFDLFIMIMKYYITQINYEVI